MHVRRFGAVVFATARFMSCVFQRHSMVLASIGIWRVQHGPPIFRDSIYLYVRSLPDHHVRLRGVLVIAQILSVYHRYGGYLPADQSYRVKV